MPEFIFGDTDATKISIPYTAVEINRYEDRGTALRTGFEGQRQDVVGSVTAKFEDFSGGGLVSSSRVHSWLSDLNKYAYNEGLQTHIEGGLYLPYELTTQQSITDGADISGARAANLRAHGFEVTLGQSKRRAGFAHGKRVFVTTSDSDASMKEITGATAITDNILCAKEITVGGTRVLAFGSAGQTDGCWYITDITADPIATTNKVFTYPNSNDRVWAIEHLPQYGYVVFYGIYNNEGPGWFGFKDSDTAPVTPKRLQRTLDRDIANPSNTVTSDTRAPSVWAEDATGATNSVSGNWDNKSNTAADDANYSTSTEGLGTGSTNALVSQGFGHKVPTGSIITGRAFAVKLKEGNASDNAFIDGTSGSGIFTYYNGSRIGDTLSTATEISTTEGTITGGSDGDLGNYLTGYTAAMVNDISYGCGVQVNIKGAIAGNAVSINYITSTIYYIPPGTSVDLPSGGWSRGKLPSNTDVIPLVLPQTSEATTVNQPRSLWYSTFSYHTDGDRLTVEVTPVTTNMNHIETYAEFLDGVLVAGDSKSGVGKALRFINSAGDIRNLSLPTTHGSNAWGVVSIHPFGEAAILDMAYESGAEAQWMYWIDSTFHNSFVLQSKEATIAATPIGWTTTILGSELQNLYRVFPASTNTDISRVFVPRNIFDDPILANTSQTKHDGPLDLRTVELDLGAEEMNKVITGLSFIGRQISATNSTYGTVEIQMEIGGDTSFASAAVDTGALAASLLASSSGEYKVPSSGKGFRSAMLQWTLDNARSSSTKTPNGLAALIQMTAEPMPTDRYTFTLDGEAAAQKVGGWTNLLALMDTLTNTSIGGTQKGDQTLIFSDQKVLAHFSGWGGAFNAVNVNEPIYKPALDSQGNAVNPTMTFDSKRGSPA